jgi:glyoxylase-like metal-dependent hydrolase (beta-lactamase superfamily II)
VSGVKKIIDKAWLVPLGRANSVLLEGDDGELTLVDAGYPGHEAAIFDALRSLGHHPEDLRHLVFTHAHPDHLGCAAAVVKRTGATTWIHSADASIAESGGPFRPMRPAPGLVQQIAFRLFFHADEPIAPVRIDRQVRDGETLPVAGGLQVVHTPGHSAGHVSLMWKSGGLLIVGDAGSNVLGLSDPLGFEDREQGRRSQRQLAALDFDAMAFGHGGPISRDALRRVQRKWGSRP